VKIKRIDVFQRDLPYSGGVYVLSGGRTFSTFDATFVRVTTDNGLEGWGESTPFGSTFVPAHAKGVRAGIAEMAPHLLGLDPRHVDRVNEAMDQALLGHLHAKTPIDVACWDIFGKAANMAVCDLLGGRTGDSLPLISSIYSGDPQDMVRRVREHRQQGYAGHSLKVGDDPALDAARIQAVLEERQPGEFYHVDANGGMTVENGLRLLRLLPRGLDIVLESPCATWRECMSLRRRSDIPMMWDELAAGDEALIQLISQDAAEGINLKISKAGGLTRGRRQRDICIAAGYTMSVQETTGSDIAFAALVHLGQTVPRRLLRCVLECRDMVTVKTADGDFPVADDGVMAPEAPGLGIVPRLEVLGEPVASYA
jgi:L-alanine-DL-glutamate epimerase-like enolase superfamily enzyme